MNNEIKLIVVTLSLIVVVVMVDLTPIGAAPRDTMVEDFNIPYYIAALPTVRTRPYL